MSTAEKNTPWPDFIIVGAPKCGTTSIARYLNAHPDVYVAPGEPHYFGSDIEFDSLSKQEYLEIFREAKAAKTGEKSTWYLYSKTAAQEIHSVCPEARIVVMIRNPVDMLYSLHAHLYARTGRENIADFEEALNAETNRKQGINLPERARFPQHLYYSEIPLYTEQIQRYISLFGQEKVHIIIFDDLKSDTAKVFKELLGFLEVDPDFQPDFSIHNKQITRKNEFVHRLTMNPALEKVGKTVFPRGLRRFMLKTLDKINTSDRKKESMSPEVRHRLQQQFTPEIEKLSAYLDRDLSNWLKD